MGWVGGHTLAGEKVRLACACAGYSNISTPYIISDLPPLTPVNYINLHLLQSPKHNTKKHINAVEHNK